MQDIFQRLSELPEIIASGPVVLRALDEKLKSVSTPAEALMILQNLNFTITRQAPRVNSNSRQMNFDFSSMRAINSGRTFV